MPATNPRLTVTLQEHTALQLRRLSELTGDSQSKLVGEILSESRPVFDRLITVLEAAQKAKEAVKSASADRLADAQRKIEQQLGLVFDGFDELTGSVLAEVEAVSRRARRQVPSRGLPGTAPGDARAGKGAPPRGEKAPARAAPTPHLTGGSG